MAVACTFAVTLACSSGTCVRMDWGARLGQERGGGSGGVGRWMGSVSPVTGYLLNCLKARGAARKETCTIAMNDVLDILQLLLSRRTHNMMWSQGLRTLCDHRPPLLTHTISMVQYGSTCVALGCYGGKFFYIDVERSTRLPLFGLFYVQFNNLEDLVNHGIFAEAKFCKAYCKCATQAPANCIEIPATEKDAVAPPRRQDTK